MKKKRFSIIPKSIKSKYNWGDTVRVSGIYECSVCGNLEAFSKGEHFSQCQDCINTHETQENEWYVTNELLYFMSKNMNIEFDKLANISVRIADHITEYAGTLGFFLFHIIWFACWIMANVGWFGPKFVFDPFPFGLLTMIVSLEAIFLSSIIMMSQNVSNKKSEMRAEHEYQINLETEKNVAEILVMIKELRKETELKHEAIDELKETVEEIHELHEEEHREKEHEHQETFEEFEEHERKQFEKQEELLEEVGIDIIPESAPPIILEEDHTIEKARKEHNKRQKKMRHTSRYEKIRNPFDKSYRKEIVEETERIVKKKKKER